MPKKNDDVFAHGEYRRVISWSARLKREEAWLRDFLESCPGPRFADFGCGSGEHTAFIASLGREAVGIDQSPAQIESARELIPGSGGRLDFVQSDFASLPSLGLELFDGALCLGNVLPYLDESELDRTLAAWRDCLRPGAGLLLQWLNYTHLRASGTRSLPVNIRPGDEAGEELALVRLLRFEDEQHVLFFPTTLDLPANWEDGVSLRRTHAVRMRSWTHREVIDRLESTGFALESLRGGVRGEAFEAERSKDVVIRARREA